MPEPQSKSIYRRKSTVSVKDHGLHGTTTEDPDVIANFNHFLNERVRLPTEWSAPAPVPTTWNYEFTHNPPRLAPPLRATTPSPELPSLPSDWWHSDANIRAVNGTGEIWSGDGIFFFPDHGYCKTGISMKLARLGVGMVHGHKPIGSFVHRLVFSPPHPMLSIQWPGYISVDDRKGLRPLNIHRPLDLHPDVTLMDLAKQVSDYMFEFCENYADHCNIRDSKAILLGRRPGGVNFNRLRLVKLWTSNGGIFWHAEVAIVDDYVQH
ncbi:hypothetical protein C8R43DRAFT_952687 [Mycena crocata]|nr:hypothetical protein C8R43DRAFT_952687 [Mycena crocata]